MLRFLIPVDCGPLRTTPQFRRAPYRHVGVRHTLFFPPRAIIGIFKSTQFFTGFGTITPVIKSGNPVSSPNGDTAQICDIPILSDQSVPGKKGTKENKKNIGKYRHIKRAVHTIEVPRATTCSKDEFRRNPRPRSCCFFLF